MMRLSQMNANTVSNQKNGLNKDLLAFLKPLGSHGNINEATGQPANKFVKRKKSHVKPDHC